MTRVDFYILPSEQQEERLLFACRLAEKAYKLGHQLYIHTDDEQSTAAMDDLLWQFRAGSFIPHHRTDENITQPAPIELGHDQDPEHHHDLLINLSHRVPPFFSRFHRVAEVVVQQPKSLTASRNSYSFYRARGYPMHTHDLRNK